MHLTTGCHVGARRGAIRRLTPALIHGLAISLFVAQTALAQAVVVDPRYMPSGSPLDSAEPGAAAASSSRESQASEPASVSAVPAFEAGNISNARPAEEISGPALGPTAVKPPAPPSEFESYVQRSVGRPLKRFGADLLVPSDRDFSVPATATIPGDYPINVGDVISINTVGSIEGSADFSVDRNGEIFLPKVGKIKLIGVRYRDLRDRIASAIGLRYREFDVTVSVKRLRGIRVYVTGFANHPGAYSLNSLSTLVNAVLAAGGPASGGSFRSVKLYRNGQEVRDFDLYEFVRRGIKANDVILQNEDVLFIPPVGPQVAVVGSVNEEAIYEAKPGETLAEVLAIAGGANQLADGSRAVVYQLRDKRTVGSRQLNQTELANSIVEGGDILQVLSQGSLIHPIERQSVVVRIEGEVDRPGNYFVAPNTPLSDVISQAGGLTPRAYVYGTKLTRESVRAQQRDGYADAISQLETTLAAAPLTSDQSVGAGEREAQLRAARELLDRLRETEPDGRLVLELPYTANALPGDILLENNDRIVVPPRIDTVGVFGSVYRPASFMLNRSAPPRVRDYIERAGGTQRAADKKNIFVVRANGDVLTRKNGALAARVQPGDVIFVPVKTHSSSFWAKLRDITQIIFQLGLGAATVAAID